MKILHKLFQKKNLNFSDIPTDVQDEINLLDFSAYEDEKLIDIKNNCEKDYQNLIAAIKNLPPHFCSCRENIFEALDKYLLSQSLLSSYEQEFFYKCRICKFYGR